MKSFNKRPVIVTLLENESYQKLMGDIDADFIIYQCHGALKIKEKLPNNHMVVNDLTPNIRPDILLSQNKLAHYKILRDLSIKYKRPLFSLYHGVPGSNDLERTFGYTSDVDIFLSNDHANIWECENPTIIPPAANSTNKSFGIFTNKYTDFDSLYDVLNQMAKGMCVISPNVYEINNIIKQGYNGFLFDKNDPFGAKNIINRIINNEDLIKEIGLNAIKTIQEKYSKTQFTNNWNKLIETHFERI